MFDSVMPGLVPGIHVFLPGLQKQDVDGRDKPGHDVERFRSTRQFQALRRDHTLPNIHLFLGLDG
jgi:hypothetical protein